jgi:hypothetical protein
MRNYILALLVVAFIFLYLLAFPGTREVLQNESLILWPASNLHAYYFPTTTTNPTASAFADEAASATRVLTQRPDDWQLAMGIGKLQMLGTDVDATEGIAHLQQAVRLSREKPAALMALALAQMKQLTLSRREEVLGYEQRNDPHVKRYQEKILQPYETASVRETLTRLLQVDSNNAAPKALLAWLAFGEKKDTEALAWLQAAALAPCIDFYSSAFSQAEARALKAAGLTDYEASWEPVHAFAEFHNIASLRAVARLALYKGKEAQAAGRNREAVNDFLSVARFGKLLRTQANSQIEFLAGTAIEAIGISPAYSRRDTDRLSPARESASKPAGTAQRSAGDHIIRAKSYDFFRAQAGAAVTDRLYTDLKQSERLHQLLIKRMDDETVNADDAITMALLKAGVAILVVTCIFLIIVAFLTLLAWRKQVAMTQLHLIWQIVLALLISLPALIVWRMQTGLLGNHSDIGVGMVWIPSSGLETQSAIFWVTIPAIFLLLFFTLSASCWLGRRSHSRAHFGVRWLTVLGQVGTLALIFLALVYTGLAHPTAHHRMASIHNLQVQMNKGEMTLLREKYPEYFRDFTR